MNGNLMRTFHLIGALPTNMWMEVIPTIQKATDHSHARFSFDEVHGFFGSTWNPGDTVTIEIMALNRRLTLWN